MHPMRVLHVNTNKSWGGGENQVLHLLRGLQMTGVEVVLAAIGTGKLAKTWQAESGRVIPLPERLPLLHSPLSDIVRKWHPHLVHAHDSGALDVAHRPARRANIPLLLSRRIASPLRNNMWSRRKYSPQRVSGVLAISLTVRDAMLHSGYPADRIMVAPSGLDFLQLENITPAPEFSGRLGGRFLVGGLGALTWKKNWSLLLQVAAQPRLRDLDIHWVIAGDGPLRDDLMHEARRLGLEHHITFLGFRADGLHVLRALDALFFPSLMEGASVTVREAMAMRIPTIINNTPGCVESLGGHGWIISKDDPAKAASTIAEVLLHPEKTRKVVEAAYLSAKNRFSFTQTIQDTLSAYWHLLGIGS